MEIRYIRKYGLHNRKIVFKPVQVKKHNYIYDVILDNKGQPINTFLHHVKSMQIHQEALRQFEKSNDKLGDITP